MNTNRLKSKFWKVYSDFFNGYDIVISSPITFVFVWDSSYHNNGNTSIISQKITVRNYIWYNKNIKSNKINYKCFDWTNFIDKQIENDYSINKEILKKIWLKGEVAFLSEMDWRDPPSIQSDILLLKMYTENKIDENDFELLKVWEEKWKDIIYEINELDNKLFEKYNFFWWDRNTQIFLPWTILKSNSHILTMEKEDKIVWRNMWKNNNYFSLNLTISLITPEVAFTNKYNTKTIKEKEERLLNFMDKEEFELKTNNDISIISAVEKINNFFAIKIFQNLNRLYENNQTWEHFFSELKTYRTTIKALFKNVFEWINRKKTKQQIKDELNINNFNFYMDMVWITSNAKFFIVSKKTWNIDDNLIKKINNKNWLNLKLDYSSYYDWFEINGSILEQDKQNFNISEFVSDYKIEKYNNNKTNIVYWEYEDLFIKYSDSFLLNTLDDKIYFSGEKITSKDFCSQNTLLHFLIILLNSDNYSIRSSQLPKSSYSKSKTELQNKIILPFIKFIKKHYNLHLDCELIWPNNDFNIKFSDLQKVQIVILRDAKKQNN
jgi:hypothetical protein